MSEMCQSCGLEMTTAQSDDISKVSFCRECEEKITASSVNEESQLSNASKRIDGLGSVLHGHIPDDMNAQSRDDGVDALDTRQGHSALAITEHVAEHGNGNLLKDTNLEDSDVNSFANRSSQDLREEKNYRSNSLALEDGKSAGIVKIEKPNTIIGEGQHTRVGDDSNGVDNAVNLPNGKIDYRIWIPPEPEDMESESHDKYSIANIDDDDDYYDGSTWGQMTSLSSLDDELGNHHSHKEERQKAMMEAMNGQFKILVSRLLASEGMGLSDGEGAKDWFDIVTSLSWEAALLIKPDANEGRAMDPGSYVKVKCIASGSRSESQVIKGLVFKKNTAHKHMPTKLRNPRLLLLKGSVGHSAGLSSLNSVEKEDDYKKPFNEMIERCNPDLVLVEKTVSRDVQESLLKRGITLVFDINFSRLERIARCTGSQIISCSDSLIRPKLQQCDSFYVEKFVEEYKCAGEGGKKLTKTLMFLEGCPRPLGCTILLKGASSDELKKVKRVVQYTVFAAYHLILETSFFVDQRTFFYDLNAVKETSRNESMASVHDSIRTHNVNDATVDVSRLQSLDVPISDGLIRSSIVEGMYSSSDLVCGGSSMMPASTPLITTVRDNSNGRDAYDEPRGGEIILSDSSPKTNAPGQLVSSVSASLGKYLGENIPPLTAESISLYFGFNGKMPDSENTSPLVSPHLETFDPERKDNVTMKQEGRDNGFSNGEKAKVESVHNGTIEQCSEKQTGEVHIEGKDDIESALEPQSILVLLSTYCIPKQSVCEQTHFSRINYYGNSDVSLGRYLQDILLSKEYSCSSCGQPPEDHMYRYTHQNGNITVLVKCLPEKFTLSGGADGKIWMWTQCLKCEHESGSPKPTRRVVMSSAARGLSFGKFLELSFSSHSAASRLSRCGHLLHRDCLRFFGMGSKVAMFKYTPVEMYAACKPPPVLEFCNPSEQEWFLREATDVISKGDHLFLEITNLLTKLKAKCFGSGLKQSLSLSGSIVEFDDVEKLLMQEKADFEASLLKATNHNVHVGNNNCEFLDLNWLIQELMLMLYIWDHRLGSIFLHMKDAESSKDAADKQLHKENDAFSSNKFLEENISEGGHEFLEASIQIPIESEDFTSHLETNPSEVSNEGYMDSAESMSQEQSYTVDSSPFLSTKIGEEEHIPIEDMQEDNSAPVLIEPMEPVEKAIKLEPESHRALNIEMGALDSRMPGDFNLQDPNWIWLPFSKLREELRQDLHDGFLSKFEFVNTYSPTYFSPMPQLAAQVMNSLHFRIGPGGSVMSVLEDEISSIIACALAMSEYTSGSSEKIIGHEDRGGEGEAGNAMDSSLSLTSSSSVPALHGSSTSSSEAARPKSSRSFSLLTSDELATFGSDGSLFSDPLMPMENLHPEISIGSSKFSGKSKYSVVCIYAKQFYSFRKKCCSSEMAYMSSLCRCRKWDAQGGKSKVLFAKTMDDRFIIKQIKKPELESFLKFGPDYFKHITLSLDSGSQTCLAKILGIYQVRQYKSGKEVKIDVVVMENLFFGRNISRKYDLKGAVFSRYISNSNDSENVFLDENFVEDMRLSPIYIGGKNKNLLQRAIWNDTSFLTSINVMDYSLLVGVDRMKHEIVFGIIDYLRQYTWDKQLETWVKASLVVPRNELPTVISPKEYKKRFRKFMAKYFLTIPDSWNSQQCLESCKFCNNGSNNSSDLCNAQLSEQQNIALARVKT